MSISIERLDEADACHDDDAPRAGALLREVDPVPLDESRRPRLAFLLNHVLGEKLADWRGAHQHQQRLLKTAGDKAPVVLWRQAAVAARLAGDGAAELACTAGVATASGTSHEQAAQLVTLAGTTFQLPGLPAPEAGQAALRVLGPLESDPAWRLETALDASAAACCNNISTDLSERPLADLGLAPLRAAMGCAAELAQRLWQRAGQWVHHERAWYQRAVVANTLGEPHRARGHAQAGLALLDANDVAGDEFVDRAFLELELAHACERLGSGEEAAAARARAQALSKRFGDEGLERWFAARTARLETLRRQ